MFENHWKSFRITYHNVHYINLAWTIFSILNLHRQKKTKTKQKFFHFIMLLLSYKDSFIFFYRLIWFFFWKSFPINSIAKLSNTTLFYIHHLYMYVCVWYSCCRRFYGIAASSVHVERKTLKIDSDIHTLLGSIQWWKQCFFSAAFLLFPTSLILSVSVGLSQCLCMCVCVLVNVFWIAPNLKNKNFTDSQTHKLKS